MSSTLLSRKLESLELEELEVEGCPLIVICLIRFVLEVLMLMSVSFEGVNILAGGMRGILAV